MATEVLPQSIADWYHACIEIFTQISMILDSLEHGVTTNDKTFSLVQDQVGRFRVWAGNMGAHRVGRMSLDYKLREASHVHSTVLELLEELNESLAEMLAIIAQKRPLDAMTGTEVGGEDEDGSGEENNISETESTASGNGDGTSDLIFALSDITNIISCLYNLSVAIRQPIPRDRLLKYAEIDLTHYEFYDNQHVLEKFPLAKPFLIKRLGNANTQRRQYFRYRLLHHEKIAKDVDRPSGIIRSQKLKNDVPISRAEGDQEVATKHLSQGKPKTATVVTAARTTTTVSIVLKSTMPPSPLDNIEIESDGGQTATSFGTMMETATVKELQVPDPPNLNNALSGNVFECPYCYYLVAVKNTKAWRRHVFRDLRPYVCTFESCSKPNRLFDNRHDWYDHEVQHHRREWYCAKCTLAFSTIPSFTSHLRVIHLALVVDEQELAAVVGSCERALSTPQVCPLCNFELTPDRLRSHLSRHMRQLALFTLPRLEKEDSSEGDSVSNVGGVGSKESRNEEDKEMSALEFDSNPSQGSVCEEGGDRTGLEEVIHGSGLQNGTGSEVHTTLHGYSTALDEVMPGATDHETNVNLVENLMMGSRSARQFLVRYQKALELGRKYQSGDGKISLRAGKIYEEALELCRLKVLELMNSKTWVDAATFAVRAARISECFVPAGGEQMEEMRDLLLLVGSKFVLNSPPSAGASVDTSGDTSAGAMSLATDLRFEFASAPSRLITAVRSQDANEVQKLLLEAVNVNSTNSPMDKTRALDYAAQRGNKEILILLHLYGASSSRAPLWWAVDGTRSRGKSEDECVDVLKLLLDFGHDPNRLEPKEGESPLHLTAKLNLMKAMGTLLAKAEPPSTRSFASIDLQDQHGLGPLSHSAKEGHGAMVKLLLDYGANVKGGTGPGKKSPVHYAAIHKDRMMLKILHANGSDIEAFDLEGKSPLYYAARGGGRELLETLLEMGADINRKCPQSQGGRTTLHWMALEGDAAAIRILLEKEASLDEGDEAGKTALHHAVREGHRVAVYVLLEKGAALDKKDKAGKTSSAYAQKLPDGGVAKDIIWMLDHGRDMKLDDQKQTALHRAASKSPGDELAVDILLRCDPDRVIHIRDSMLWTPLHCAVAKGHGRLVQILLDKGAEVNVKNNVAWAPLHQAANDGHERIAQMLLAKGAEVNVKHKGGWTPLHQAANEGHERIVQMLLGNGANVNVKTQKGLAPLHLATSNGHGRIVQMLLDKGAEVNVKHKGEWTPLHQAAAKGHERVVQVLLEKGAEVNIRDVTDWTPLHHATSNGHERVVQMLLDKAVEVNVKNKDEWTPLHQAAINGYEWIVQMLLDKEAQVNVKNKDGWTPLHQAASEGHERIVQMLLDIGAEVNAKNKGEWTPLHQATAKSHERVVQLLLAKGAEVNARDNEAWTPLHLAAQDGHMGVIRALLHRGADIVANTDFGYTPLHIAVLGQHPQAIQLLVDSGASLHSTDSEGNNPESYATWPFGMVEINPEVAEMFQALRNGDPEGATTKDDGQRVLGAVMESDNVIKEVKPVEEMLGEQLVPTPGVITSRSMSQENELDENESDGNESDGNGSGGNGSGENEADESRSDENGLGENKSNENESDENRSDGSRSGECEADKNGADKNRLGENELDENGSGENEAGGNKLGENESDENRSAENEAGENGSDENESDENGLGGNEADENEVDENRLGENESHANEALENEAITMTGLVLINNSLTTMIHHWLGIGESEN